LSEPERVSLALHRLEFEDIELSTLLRVIDSLDETIVPLLESIHLVGTLLLHQRRFHLLFGHLLRLRGLLSIFISFLDTLSLLLLCLLHGFLALLLLGLDGLNELLLLELLGFEVLVLALLLVLFDVNTET